MAELANMAETIEAGRQLHRATAESGRRGSAHSGGYSVADASIGQRKRRPASPEVVIAPPRPRTPSSNNNNNNSSFEQSQSPTKKQRTVQETSAIDGRFAHASIFTALNAERPPAINDKAAGAAITGLPDTGLVSTTETFAHLSTLTPGSSSRPERNLPSEAASSRPTSKPTSPTSRRQSNVVVEILQSRPGSANTSKSSPSRQDDRTVFRQCRSSSPVMLFASENKFNAGKFTQAASETQSSSAPSPELEEVLIPKSRSRRVSPQPTSSTSSSLPNDEPSASSSSGSTLLEACSTALPPSSQLQSTASGIRDSPSVSTPEGPALNALPPSAMFNDPNDAWFTKPARQAAAKKKQYVETSDDEDSDEELYVSASASKALPKRKQASRLPSRKGKERATDSEDISRSESDTLAKPNGKTPAKESKKPKPRASSTKKKATLPKSNSENALSGKAKAKSKGRRKGSMSTGSSDLDNLFMPSLKSPSPAKRKVVASQKTTASAKKTATSRPVKSSFLSAGPLDDTSDDDLPTLPFSSQPPPQSQAATTFDLLDIDDIAFVAVPARRKTSDSRTFLQVDSSLSFWWPAKITNRNRRNFTVSLIFDASGKDIEYFSETAFVIAEQNLDHDHLQKLSSRCNPFPKATQAYEAVLNHSEAESYTLPSEAAYASAISAALKRDKDDAQGSPKKDVKVVESSNAESGSDTDSVASVLDKLRGSGQRFGSDTEDDLSDIEIGTVALGKNRHAWWPCRVVDVLTRKSKAGQQVDTKHRLRPYRVEFYPRQIAMLSRKDIELKDDKEFYNVPLGEIHISEVSSLIPVEKLRDILPEMVETVSGKYTADRKRHYYFMHGTAAEKSGLSRMAVYGQFERNQINQLSDFLLDWALGRSTEPITIPLETPFHTFASDEQKSNYVALVLLPVALELLYLKDDPEVDDRAKERLTAAGNIDPTQAEIRLMAHEVAAEELDSNNDWWESVLALRRADAIGKLVKKPMRTELDDEDVEAMGQFTRRRKANVNYKE